LRGVASRAVECSHARNGYTDFAAMMRHPGNFGDTARLWPSDRSLAKPLAIRSLTEAESICNPAARIVYTLVPGDDFGPPTGLSDMTKREPLMRHDALNKHPRRWGSGCAPGRP
jgi:hypothetical protein